MNSAENSTDHNSTPRLPPTTDALLDANERPYFLWWTAATVGRFKEHLASSDPEERAYWMGALLREANTRDGARCGNPTLGDNLGGLTWSL